MPARGDLKEAEAPQQPSQPPPQQTGAPLERLPNELLTSILCAASSTADVHALIRASPILLSVFLSVKKLVLVTIVARDLGPALRDAVADAFLVPNLLDSHAPLPATIPLLFYESLPPRPWVNAMALQDFELCSLVRTHRALAFFVDEFAATRLPELGITHPEAAYPLTASERRRLVQALVRLQFVVSHVLLKSGGGDLSARYCDTLAPWQCHLISDAAAFVTELMLERTAPDPAVARLPRAMQRPGLDLVAIRRRHLAHRARHTKTEEQKFYQMRGIRMVTHQRGVWSMVSGPGAREGECYQRFKHRLRASSEELPPLVFSPGDDDHPDDRPPFAWVDAHAGQDCQAWGDSVRLYKYMYPQSAYQLGKPFNFADWTGRRLGAWRWLGVPFWDRRRVEMFKATEPAFATGWIKAPPPSDELCLADDVAEIISILPVTKP